MISANTRKIRKSERLTIASLSLEELMQIKSGRQDFLEVSVLSETIQSAVARKIETMKEAPVDVHPWLTYWIICRRNGGKGIGVIGCKGLPDEDGFVELGYAVAKERRRQGYMTEAVLEFMDWLYECPFCNGAVLYIRQANHPSIKTAEKCGFLYEKMYGIYGVYRYTF